MTGIACAQVPSTKVDKQAVATTIEAISKTVPIKMDIFQFFRENGYFPVRPYKVVWTGGDHKQGTASWVNKPTTGCTSSRNCSVDWKVQQSFSPYTDVGHLTGAKSDFVFTQLKNKALTRLYEKLSQSDAGLGETLATGNKLVDMFAGTAKRIASAARAVRRHNFKMAADQLGIGVPKKVSKRNSFSKNWLAYRYGWLPLISDAYGTAKAIFDSLQRPPVKVINARTMWTSPPSTKTRPMSLESSLDYTGTSGVPDSEWFQWRLSRSGTQVYRVSTGFVFEYTRDAIDTSLLNSLGLMNPAKLAWELVPYSFIVDWFVNVSDVLGQYSAFTGKRILAHYVTYVYKSGVSTTSSVVRGPRTTAGHPTASFSSTPAHMTVVQGWMEREVLANPSPIKITVTNGLNLKRVIDAIALGRSRTSHTH